MSLTQKQVEALLAPLSPGRVRSLDGNSHLEAWDDRRWLLRIFGWGGFDIQTIECVCVSERSFQRRKKNKQGEEYGDPYEAHTVVYRAQVRLTIKDPDGTVLAVFEDGAVGDGINQPSLLKAHDFAMKTALSQALKRCCVNLGDQFGLSLYDNGRAGTTVVGKSIAHDLTTDHPVREDVQGGELDEQQVTSEPAGQSPESAAPAEAAPPPPSQEPVDSPSGSVEEVEAAQRNTVEALRERIVEVLQAKDRKHALADLTRIQLDAGKAKVMNEPTTTPAGEDTTVALLIDSALKFLSRKAS